MGQVEDLHEKNPEERWSENEGEEQDKVKRKYYVK
jgi:hypothetical protein